MPLITVDGFREDAFASLADDVALPDGAVLVSLSRFQAERDALIARNAPLGVRLRSDESPERLGEDELRDIVEDAIFLGPLVDYQAQGSKVEYIGKDLLDGDDVYRLKVTLKNGDIYYYYLDPETFLEVRMEKVQFIRGAVHESVIECGSYKLVAGVYMPFTYETGSKQSPDRSKITYDKIEPNVTLDPAEFKMPAGGKEL